MKSCCKKIVYLVSMESITYRRDQFEYETMKELHEGLSRLAIKCLESNDSTKHTLSVELKLE